MKLPKIYEPGQYESDIYALWEKSGVFTADPTSDKEHFSIAMPPPNETGTLSIGHALFITLQDIMARYNRAQGKDVLWLPGTDHAALPVNAIIEKKLAEEGTDKHAIGRDEFLRRTKEFVGNSRDTMINQMRAVGASADWSRLRYTLDDALNRCVNETFTKMYDDGLIYRGARIVNWDPNLQTTISDDEVEHKEEKGKFYTFKYGPFEIGTARPETKFGDKYVVMHPDDERYKDWKHGDTLEVEWINGPITATIIKDEAADPDFGTGVMTITPWHSHLDFELAEKHALDKEQIIDFHGNLLPVAQEFAGMSISEARDKIVDKLKQKGLLVGTDENYVHNLAVNERGKGVIEPQIKLQWWIDVNKEVVDWKGSKRSLKQVMQSVIHEGDIEIMPKRFEKIYFHWVDNLRDWCISRQIWWGHRIPVWYRHDTDGREETFVGTQPPTDQSEGWNEWEQDPDTLDTWFSSALWTWSTLVDPEKASDYSLDFEELLKQSPDFQAYHPTSVMETGWDILFFWVTRMILSTTYMTGQVPFKKVYLHGLIRAEDGKKMSKSRPESIIDPLDVIPKYGTDALRMALIMGVSPGADQNWGWGKIEANRNFCNKLWNIARYIEDLVGDTHGAGEIEAKSAADHWVLRELGNATYVISEHLDALRFGEAYEVLYHFVWDDFADWYIEASKAQQNLPLLQHCLEAILTIAHPFAPFVTETIWQTLGWQGSEEDVSTLAAQGWPTISTSDTSKAKEFEIVKDIVSEARFITRALHVQGATLLYSASEAISSNADLIARLARLKAVSEGQGSDEGVTLTSTSQNAWLDIDKDTARQYGEELAAKKYAQEKVVAQLEGRLSNKSYVDNAPEAVVQQTKDRLEEARQQLEAIETEQKRFS
jgi:valyl-tRNA synthetase